MIMKRREFIELVVGAAAWPVGAWSQQAGKLHRIGFLWDSPTVFPDALEAFRQGLAELGYVEGASCSGSRSHALPRLRPHESRQRASEAGARSRLRR